MAKYITKRFIASVVTLFIVITLTFFLMRLMPGSPFLSDKISPAALENMNAKYGLDKPMVEQYFIFLKNLLHGDFGTSMVFKGREVTDDIIFKFFPASAKLGLVTAAFATVVGVIFGMVAALNQGKWIDKVMTFIATVGITVPSFVMASALVYFVGVKWRLLPITSSLSGWKEYVMPVIALSGSSMAFITRLTRTKYVEVKNSDFMRTARSKGLSRFSVVVRHGLRNSIVPVVTYLGPLVAGLLTGSFIIEKIFNIPGLGRNFVESVSGRDYSVVMGVVIFYCILIIFANFVVDVLYVIIDPRIKLVDGD